jgi:hypothetical protein
VIKEDIKEWKDQLRELVKKDPSLIKADPELMDLLRMGEHYNEYFKRKNISSLTENEEDLKKIPEIIKMFLETDESILGEEMDTIYFSGKMDEDNARLLPHVEAVMEFETEYEEEAEKVRSLNNHHWVENLKRDTKNYIDTVLSEQFQKYSTSYAKSLDNMRIDCGLVIHRDPIFLGYI